MLLRRLAPAMRHHLVVNLQPIGMVYEVMQRRLRAPQPDLSQALGSAHKIHGFARAALSSCLDVVTWLVPEENAAMPLADGVRECAGLLASNLSFRGYGLRNEVGPLPGQVRRAALRTMLTALLIHATDEQPSPAELVLTAQAGAEGAVLTLTVRPAQGAGGFATEAGYRGLAHQDLEALAAAESVRLEREGWCWRLSLPWVGSAQA
ncbi:Hypothetical protein Rta_07750 [Ramlibacter tataouinensis TTB310]|uniref:Signal transduction histidine kinase-like protein n=1 Tax=Ramlibacter tataouinensis (strain ATCC BAA-407 / DSM 14655 / LMG 21543 / TTB310) TaxID=365046 RepID=F5XXQ3_RAMTT|nr:Hypothetical protein Rta_07750 [Ramlibacter tataouinensis TTB310]